MMNSFDANESNLKTDFKTNFCINRNRKQVKTDASEKKQLHTKSNQDPMVNSNSPATLSPNMVRMVKRNASGKGSSTNETTTIRKRTSSKKDLSKDNEKKGKATV